MLRGIVGGVVACIVVVFFIDLLTVSDREQVEQDVERLLDLAREGGDEAVDEILAALARDYRGAVSRKTLEANLRRYVGKGQITSLVTGGYKTIWAGEEIHVPLLRITVKTDGFTQTVLLSVTYARRDGAWKVVDISRWPGPGR